MERLSKKEIGLKIRALREAKGLDQGEMAHKIGAYQSAISKWERGENLPTGQNRKALCDFLGVPWKELAYREDEVTVDNKDAEIAALKTRLEALERRLPNDIEAKKDEKLQEMEAEIERLKALIGPHKALLKRLQGALPIEIEAIYRALKVPREDAQAKKKGEAG